jgi:hypothetical protein
MYFADNSNKMRSLLKSHNCVFLQYVTMKLYHALGEYSALPKVTDFSISYFLFNLLVKHGCLKVNVKGNVNRIKDVLYERGVDSTWAYTVPKARDNFIINNEI